jgi:hypothetical protein
MKYALLTCVLAASAALGQTPSTGVLQEWEVQKLLQNLEAQTKHLPGVIEQIKLETWMAKGAPDTYLAQWKSSQAELKYLLATSDALIKQPERLTLALETYFRMQAVDTMLGSLIEGIRKYQNPSLAELVQGVVDENSANRDKLRQYIQDLAAQKEQEFAVADKEAQRCRATLMRQPAPTGRKSKN